MAARHPRLSLLTVMLCAALLLACLTRPVHAARQPAIYAERVHVFLGFDSPDVLNVEMFYILSNDAATSTTPIAFDLPSGAANLQLDAGMAGDSRQVQYLLPIPSGQGTAQFVFSYDLPYQNGSLQLNLLQSLPARAVMVILPAEGITLSSPQLTDEGWHETEDLRFRLFSVSDFPAGETLSISLSGQPASTLILPEIPVEDTTLNLWIGAAFFLLTLGGIAWWTMRQRRAAETAPAPAFSAWQEDLLRQMAALDDAHEAGKLSQAEHAAQRAKLKTRLMRADE